VRINNLIIVFFVISYFFSIGAEIEIILSEDLLANQETLKDFQLTLLHINSNEKKFLYNIFEICKKILNVEEKNVFNEILSRKSLVVSNNESYYLKKLSLQSLDREKIIKENIFTFMTIKQFSKQNQTFNIVVKIVDTNVANEKRILEFQLKNYNQDVFKKNFLI
jgi:hypothetical protein